MSTYQKYKCVEVTECKLYMRIDDTNNYKRDNTEYRMDVGIYPGFSAY